MLKNNVWNQRKPLLLKKKSKRELKRKLVKPRELFLQLKKRRGESKSKRV